MAERKPLVLIDGAIQQLQDGDTVAGATTTATAPEITNPDGSTLFNSINENETKTCKIKDYDPDVNYIISANKGAIGSISSDGTFTYTAPDITDGNNTTDNIFIYYTIGTIVSATKQYSLNIIYVPIEADGVLSNTNFVANMNSSTNLTVDTNTLTAIADNAVYIENPVEQESVDTDWVAEKNTAINYIEPEINVHSESSPTNLKTDTEIHNGDAVDLIKNDNTIVSGNIGVVTEIQGYKILDILKDGSCKHLYTFEDVSNNTILDTNTSNSNNLTKVGSCVTIKSGGIFSKYLSYTKCDTSDYVQSNAHFTKINNGKNNWALSFWVYYRDTSAKWQSMVRFGNAQSDRYPGIFFTPTNGQLYIHHLSESYYYVNDCLVNNQWNNIVISEDSQDIYIYVNGNKYSKHTASNSLNTDDVYLFVGDNQYNKTYDITQIRYFTRHLNETDVHNLYNTEKNYTTIYNGDISSYGLSSVPSKAFFNDQIDTKLAFANDVASLDLSSASNLSLISKTYDGAKFKNMYENKFEKCRAIQRQINITKLGTKILTPYTTDMFK